MSDLFKHSKKALTAALTVSTIVWSVGLFALAPVVDAAAGDLVKAAGNTAVYLVDADGVTIHPFPHANVYTSWGFPADFSTVLTTDISGFTVGNDVEFRDGSLVRALEASAVYVKADGELRPVVSAEVFETLGYNYDNITWLPQSFLDKYATGTLVNSTTTHPNGTLVKYASSSTIYVLEGGAKRAFASSDVINANGYGAIPVITVPSSETYSDGSKVVVKEASMTVPSGVGTAPSDTNPPGQTTPVGSGLSVAIASDNPAVATILSDDTGNSYPQALVPFLKVNLSAGSDGAVKVTTMKFMRTGVSSDSDIGNLYLYDNSGTRLAEYTSFNDKIVTFTNSSGLFTISAGGTAGVTLKGDLARSSTSVAAGKTIGFSLVSASDVTTDGASVSGSFPSAGNLMSTAQVTDLGQAYLSSYTTYPSTIKADATNQELWRFTVTTSAQKMQVKKVVLTMVGTIASTDVRDLKLEVGGVQLGTTQTLGSDNKVTFSNLNYEIPAGQSKTLVLRGTMNGGASKSFKFTIQRTADIELYDVNYNVYNTIAKDAITTAFALIEPVTTAGTSVSSGTITTSVASDSPTGNVADGATAVTLAKFGFQATGEDVKVESLPVAVAITNNDGGEASIGLVNVKTLLDGTQVGTTASAVATSAAQTFTYGNTFRITAGETRYLTVVADLSNSSLEANDTVAITINAGTSNAQGITTLSSLSTTAQTGRTLTVSSGAISITKNSAFADRSATSPTGTKTATNVQIASFIITAGAGEGADVTQIVLKDVSTVSQMGDNFQNMKIMNGATQIGDTIGSLDSSATAATYTYTPSSAIRIAAGSQYVVDVYADIKSSPADEASLLSTNGVVEVDAVSATGATTGSDVGLATGQDTGLQNAYISANGNLDVLAGPNTPVAQHLVMGATAQEVAQFKLSASVDEDVSVTEIYLAATVASDATGTFSNIKLYNGTTQVGTTAGFGNTSTTTYAVAPFTGITNLTIPRSQSVTLTVKADVSMIPNATSADTATFALLPDYDGSTSGNQEAITAKGLSSGASITGASLDC